MTRSPFLMLGFVAALLAAIVAGELTGAAPGANRAMPAVSYRPHTRATPPVLPDRLSEWIERALARPLFNPDRRPLPGASVAAGNALPRLTGIVVSPSGSVAIFSLHAGGQPVVASVGGTVGSWTVTQINPVQVTIERARLVLVLHPAFDRGPASPEAGSTPGGAGGPAPNPPNAEIPAITRLLHHQPQ